MPRELARLTTEFKDIKKRLEPFLDNMDRLNNNFWNETNGNWNRFFSGVDMLADRLKEIGANSILDDKAKSDGEVKTIAKGIADAKADCIKISKEYYVFADRVRGVRREIAVLQKDVDKVIKEKSGIFTRSKSLPQIKQIKTDLAKLDSDLNLLLAVSQAPHKVEVINKF